MSKIINSKEKSDELVVGCQVSSFEILSPALKSGQSWRLKNLSFSTPTKNFLQLCLGEELTSLINGFKSENFSLS